MAPTRFEILFEASPRSLIILCEVSKFSIHNKICTSSSFGTLPDKVLISSPVNPASANVSTTCWSVGSPSVSSQCISSSSFCNRCKTLSLFFGALSFDSIFFLKDCIRSGSIFCISIFSVSSIFRNNLLVNS